MRHVLDQIELKPLDGKGSARTLQVGQGDFFGDVGFIAARRRTIEVVARKDTVLIELTRRAAVKLLAIVAVVLAAMNLVGGFVVTDRMLEMFATRKPARRERRTTR